MAIGANAVWEIQTGGDDTNNGGGFDPGRTAGMFTDGAATSATGASPVFSSASYNFAAGDVGHWVFIASGTNWTPGWYQIASVASNQATLTGTAGSAVLYGAGGSYKPTTATGCATTASPTGATWSIDYSQSTTARYTYTDLASAGAGLTVSSAAKPFAKEQVGNVLVITGGTNFTAGRYVIASVAAGVATVQGPGNITTGVGANGTGSQGGCLASPGLAGSVGTAGNAYFIKSGTFTITSATQNIAAGCFKPAGGPNGNITWTEGYQTVRGDRGTRPTLILGTVSTSTILDLTSATYHRVFNLIIDGNSQTSSRGINASQHVFVQQVKVQNCTNTGCSITLSGGLSVWIQCEVTGCSTQPAVLGTAGGLLWAWYVHDNTVTGYSVANCMCINCLADTNTGASSDGFYAGTTRTLCFNCSSYGNGRDGFRSDTGAQVAFVNCIAEGNTGVGFGSDTATPGLNPLLLTCAGFNNTGGDYVTTTYANAQVRNFVTLTASPFANAAGGNFALNGTSGGGAACQNAGLVGVFPGGLSTAYLDLGAVQHLSPAGIFIQ